MEKRKMIDKLTRMTKREVWLRGGKIPTLTRIKIGKALFVYASLPLLSVWAYTIAIPLMIPLSPSVWAKSKLIYFKERMRLR
jgi:hypothetical protein